MQIQLSIKSQLLYFDPSIFLFHFIISVEQMDLPYPTQKDDQLSAHLSPFARKRSLILKDSVKNIQQIPSLAEKLKRQIQSLIQLDYDYELRNTIKQQVINLNAQVSGEGRQQTFVHLCCRLNAVKCLSFLTKTYYQLFPEDYQNWINAGNRQRMTGTMLCSLTGSNDCLTYLLDAGGIDIHLIDSNKLSAYQIALNSKNNKAVKLLMDYESGSRKSKIINIRLLQQPIELKPNKSNICQIIYKCLLDCFTCEIFFENKNVNDAKSYCLKGPSLIGSGIQYLFKQQIQIGYPQNQIADNQVEWKLMSQYQDRGPEGLLYDTFSPFDIEDISHPIQNFLIVFQSLSQHPWLVRRIIQPDKKKNDQFLVSIHPKNSCRFISIDSNLPFAAKSNQPLFIADKKEGWPMLIQKALAKHYGSYYKLNQLNTLELMSTLTGWPVIRKQIKGYRQAVELMQKMNTLGYMYVLEGKPNSLLYSDNHPNSCFSVMTFYTKGDKRMVLINCPFVDPAWVQKQRHEILALKILRGHYNCRQQMTIWVEQERLKQYFSSILIAPVRSGYQKYNLNITAKSKIYFRIQVQKKVQEPIVLYLAQCDSGLMVKTSFISGWYAQKQKIAFEKQEIMNNQMLKFDAEVGQYLFEAKVANSKYQIISWASNDIKISPLQQSFGGLQWVNCLRQHLQKYWALGQLYKVQHTDLYTLAIARSQRKYVIETETQVQIIEGLRKNKQQIHLIQDGQFQYCIFRGIVRDIVFQQTC